MIAIIDYGMGNLKSITNALSSLGIDNVITNDKNVLRESDALILPGVGAFDVAMENLRESDLIDVIKEEVSKGKKILGICLGMQLLFSKGYEGEECDGLGFIDGNIIKMECSDEKIPNIGWNSLEIRKQDDILKDTKEGSFVYFVHSYYADTKEDVISAFINYGGIEVPAYVRKGNIMGMQFHPEKSGDVGLRLLKNFERLSL